MLTLARGFPGRQNATLSYLCIQLLAVAMKLLLDAESPGFEMLSVFTPTPEHALPHRRVPTISDTLCREAAPSLFMS